MASKVYFTDFCSTNFETMPQKLARLIMTAGIDQIDFEGKFVAIKIHFGELGNMAHLRSGYARDVFIVTSGEKMALYAANNITTAVKNFEDRSYAKVRGILLNRRNVPDEEAKVRAFADEHGLPIVADIPRCDDINFYEDRGMTVIEGDPTLEISQKFIELAKTLLEDKV